MFSPDWRFGGVPTPVAHRAAEASLQRRKLLVIEGEMAIAFDFQIATIAFISDQTRLLSSLRSCSFECARIASRSRASLRRSSALRQNRFYSLMANIAASL